jgi:hypothetical protein
MRCIMAPQNSATGSACKNPDNPGVLTNRHRIAHRTGRCGDTAGALQLSRDVVRPLTLYRLRLPSGPKPLQRTPCQRPPPRQWYLLSM